MSRPGVLVVGASGVLRPAVEHLVAEGHEVVAVSRGRRALPAGAVGVTVDARDAAAVGAALGDLSWVDAIVYGAAVSDDAIRMLRARTPGRFVVVRTTADADPARGPLAVPPGDLQLGWTGEAQHPWHTPEQISDAALAVWGASASEGGRVLGHVRPWSERPESERP